MAKLFGGKQDPKGQKYIKNGFTSEALKDSQNSFVSLVEKKSPVFKLSGILGLNQTVELNRQSSALKSSGQELFSGISHLEKESQILLDNRQKELQKEIEQIQVELKKLAKATTDLDQQVEIAVESNIVEVSDYQISFIQRLKNLVIDFRQNISQAGVWLESFTSKKKKRNLFWNTVKSKKGGGEQYLFSNEHSAARSAT